MELVTAEEMQQIDRRTIDEIGIPGCVLMENAGRAVAEYIRQILPQRGSEVWIFSGKGNNGGDGFVIARYLDAWGYAPRVYLLARAEQFQGDAAIHLNAIQNLGLPIQHIGDSQQLAELPWPDARLMVDALFGTGLRGGVRGFAAQVIEHINFCNCPIVSVDIPSGMNANTGVTEGTCVQATHTVTIGLPKRGLLFGHHTGQWQSVDIGFPQSVVDAQNIGVQLIQNQAVRQRLPDRPIHSHKGKFGRVLVVEGSTGLTGAAALASEAALRAGSGLVTLAIPEGLNTALEVKLTEVMTLPLPQTDTGALSLVAESPIRRFVEQVDVLAIGPGLSTHPQTVQLAQQLCHAQDKPCVVDADGLNALAQDLGSLEYLGPQTILTPHVGEMARLLETENTEVQRDPIGVAQAFAERHRITLVLKGAPTVVAGSDGRVWVNTTGNPGMATGGTGDVLTGMIAGLLAQGLGPLDAATAGVYLHGLAGDIAAKTHGMHSMLAGDLMAAIGEAIQVTRQPRKE